MTPSPIRPSDGELAILRVLWDRGSATVREVHSELSKGRDMGYTTVLKLMQIMVEKGLATRDESTRTHVYRAAQGEESTQACLLDDLLQKAFQGSAASLVVRALAESRASDGELDEIQAFLARIKEERK
ncbi:BlaI/MecI/CopY family transcriptional regulator [Mesoterricola silvestris]|uniref:Transcriptional regulator n=1 Tax=Mesoterricola silvestris TaxID=2927979 RepID=A0AA48GMJ2_9BACT|nr:BlaI/MecI/CopY family transcriptional regulator [Mesoterricola silvestris]BDU72599.1 transcriptional regulator [Mesoterricola silvestris]